MAFMTPHYTLDTFWRLELPNGESELYPELADAWQALKDDGTRHSIPASVPLPHETSYTLTVETGWWARLSADGYMDCTDWSGPFATEAEAREHIKEQYEVDPDTGDDLPEE